MALVDPSIAMSYRGVELPNQLAQYAQVQQIQNAQNQNRLAEAQMAEYQRAQAEEEGLRNYLASADLANPETRSGLTRFGKSGLAYGKALTERDTAELTQQKTRLEVQEKKKAFMSQALRDISGNPSDANITAYLEDLAANPLFSDDEKATVNSTASRLLGMPVDQRGAFMASQGAPAAAAPTTPADVATMQRLGFPLTPEGYEAFRAAQRQERMLSPEEEAQRVRIAQAGRQPKEEKDDPRKVVAFRETDAAGNVTLINKFGEVITPSAPVKGKPTATFEKTTAQRKQMGLDLDRTIVELTDASKDGGLIDQSTGSGAGRLVDVGAGFFGTATPGAIATGKLAPIADMALKMVTRFEGPQSDKDTQSYKEAAGQLADSTLPNKIRKEAAKTIVRLMKERKGQFVTQAMEAEGVGAPAAKPSLDSIFGPK